MPTHLYFCTFHWCSCATWWSYLEYVGISADSSDLKGGIFISVYIPPRPQGSPMLEVLTKAEVDSVSLWNLGSVTALLQAQVPRLRKWSGRDQINLLPPTFSYLYLE